MYVQKLKIIEYCVYYDSYINIKYSLSYNN